MSELAKEKKVKEKFFTTRNLVSCAMLAACATILTYIEFPTFIAPGFYRFNVSDLPALIGAFAMGPLAGVLIEFVRSLIMLFVNPMNPSMGIGELSNFVLGCAFVVPAALIYRHKKTKGNAILALAISGVFMSIIGAVVNAFVLIPMYTKIMSIEDILSQVPTFLPFVDSVFELCLICVLPFNLIKALVVSVITIFIYKPLSVLIKGMN